MNYQETLEQAGRQVRERFGFELPYKPVDSYPKRLLKVWLKVVGLSAAIILALGIPSLVVITLGFWPGLIISLIATTIVVAVFIERSENG